MARLGRGQPFPAITAEVWRGLLSALAGDGALTQDAQTVSGTGTLAIQAAALLTQDAQSVSSAGGLALQGDAALPQGVQTVAATGALALQADGSLAQDPQTIDATGSQALTTIGDAALVQEVQTVSGAGTLALPGPGNLRSLALGLGVSLFSLGLHPPIPPVDGFARGYATATLTAIPGGSLLELIGLAPEGYRVCGLSTTITTTFGASGGLTALLLGDPVLADRWGRQADLAEGAITNQRDAHSSSEPIAPAGGYALQIAVEGGLMDLTGRIRCTLFWERLAQDQP